MMIEVQERLMLVDHHAKNIPILSRDEKKNKQFLCFRKQTDRRTDTQTESKTDNIRSPRTAEWRSTSVAYLKIYKGGGCPGVYFRCTFSKVFKI